MNPGFSLFVALLLLTGSATASNTGEDTAGPGPLSLLDRKMVALVEAERKLHERIAERPENYAGADREYLFRDLAQQWEALLARNPESLEAHLLYGKMLGRIGERERATELFMRANAINPGLAVVKQQLGNWFAEEGEFAQALALFSRAVELAPDQAVYHFQLGEVLATYRDQIVEEQILDRETFDRDMLDAFRQAHEIEPGRVDLLSRYAEAHFDAYQPDWPAALKLWREVEQRASSPVAAAAAQLQQARVLVEIGRFGEAREMASDVTEPRFAEARGELLAIIDRASGSDAP